MLRYSELHHQDDFDDGWARERTKFSIINLKDFINVKNLRILILGCGMGYECDEWKKLGNQVTACDINKKYIKHAKRYADDTFLCDLMDRIDVDDESYDLIYCSETFEHLLSTQPFLNECKRILKKDGFLVITTDNPCSIKNIIRMVFQNSIYFHTSGHFQYFSPRDMKKLLEKNGFEVLRTRNIGNWYFSSLGDVYLTISHKQATNNP